MATCASLSPRRMVWGAVRNPTRLLGEPSEDAAGVPPGLWPMPFLAACVIHAEGGVGHGPCLRPVAVCSAAVVCCAGFLRVFVLLALPFVVVRLSVCALHCCCAARCPAAASAAVSVCLLVRSVCRRCRRRLVVSPGARPRRWLKMRRPSAAGARKPRGLRWVWWLLLLLASLSRTIPPHQPRSVSRVKKGRTAGKWKAALGMAHRRTRSPPFAVQARNQSWKDQAHLLHPST